jgi:adenylosuccinate synthase
MSNSQQIKLHTVHFEELPEKQEKKYIVYALLGNSYGDEGKGGRLRHYLIEAGGRKAKYCIRFNGSANAGHTVVLKPSDPHLIITDKKRATYLTPIKFATHQIPTGVLFGVQSIIGYGTAVDLLKLHKEINEIAEQLGRTYQEIASLFTIVPEAHVVLPEHIKQDKENDQVGSTGSGVGPVYAAKALRTGFRIEQYYQRHNDSKFRELTEQIKKLDSTSFTNNKILGIEIKSCKKLAIWLVDGDVVVMEGAQGYELDPDHGGYPFGTSSICTIAGTCAYGLNLNYYYIVGCTKAYTTYVGKDIKEEGFEYNVKHKGLGALLRYLGKEFGVTTGRSRQCLPLNLDKELEALLINQTNDWIISKTDILKEYDELLQILDQMYTNKELLQKVGQEFQAKISITDNQIVRQYTKDTDYNWDLYKTLIDRGAFSLVHNSKHLIFRTWKEMKQYISQTVRNADLPRLKKIYWFDTPESEVNFEKEVSS